MPAPGKNPLMELQKRVFASRFFTVSLLLHVIIVFTLGGTVLYNAAGPPDDFTGGEGGDGTFLESETAAVAPPVETPQTPVTPPTETLQVPTMPTVPNDITAITTNLPADMSFTIPTMAPVVASPTDALANTPPPPAPSLNPNQTLTADMAKQIGAFTKDWGGVKGGQGGPGSSAKIRTFEFTAYLAKYGDPHNRERGGDWASTVTLRDNKIVGGSLPNLLYYMTQRSGSKIKANPNPVPIDLASQDIFVHRPPFIFFTGHRDFTLTEKEVENLRKYIQSGGCIWGDSSLPGRRSRFDIAFRREMRRIISDADKDWEQLPPSHSLYTHPKNLYYQEIKEPPPGLNFYQEPVYALKYAGEVAILYTANDYGDMWQFGLNEKDKFDFSVDERGNRVALNTTLNKHRGTYFRNVTEPAVANTFKFGTNVVIHLLTRWEDRLKTAPRGL